MSSRRALGRWLLFVLGLIACCWLQAAEPSAKQPNIIFIFADDWGWGDLKIHGHPYLETPNLDRLAREGTDFRMFYSANPVCSASRAAVMTGQYPARHSIHQHFWNQQMHRRINMPDWLKPDVVQLPRLLAEVGYRTGHFGKWHLSSEMIKDAPDPSEYGYHASAVFRGPGRQIHPDNAVVEAIKFIEENRSGPFFINLWLHESHAPNYPTRESLNRFAHLPEQDKVYAATIADGDARIGVLLDAIDRLGLRDNTFIAFSSDNGPEVLSINGDDANTFKYVAGYPDSPYGSWYCVGSTGGLRARKRSLYEGGIRVPFIVRWPGHVPANAVNENSVLGTVDLLPTFCAIAGAQLPRDYQPDGENVLSILKGDGQQRGRALFWEWGGHDRGDNWPRLAVREGKWKLLMTYNRARVELYNIEQDLAEARNLAKERPEIVARLADMAQAFKATLPTEPPPEAISRQ